MTGLRPLLVWDSVKTGGFVTTGPFKTNYNFFSKILNLDFEKYCLNCEHFGLLVNSQT